jgi:uncharacterized protein (DUF983 family)
LSAARRQPNLQLKSPGQIAGDRWSLSVISDSATRAPVVDLDQSEREPSVAVPRREALWRGLRGRCPNCGIGRLFRSYVSQNPICLSCDEDFTPYRADDAPAYFTILIVGHFVVPGMLSLEINYHPPMAVHALLWIPLTLLMTIALLPRCKGVLIALLWSLGIRT